MLTSVGYSFLFLFGSIIRWWFCSIGVEFFVDGCDSFTIVFGWFSSGKRVGLTGYCVLKFSYC